MTALRFRSEQRWRMAMASACCCSVERPGLLGQSMLPTVATHTPRNSRGGSGGSAIFPGVFPAVTREGDGVLQENAARDIAAAANSPIHRFIRNVSFPVARQWAQAARR